MFGADIASGQFMKPTGHSSHVSLALYPRNMRRAIKTACSLPSVNGFTTSQTISIFSPSQPKLYVKTGESGNKLPQSFCPECGTPIYSGTLGQGRRCASSASGR